MIILNKVYNEFNDTGNNYRWRMTTFDNSPKDVPVSLDNLAEFIQQYPPEVVQGYMLALKDIFGQVEDITFFKPHIILASPAVARKKLLDFYIEKRHLIEHFEALGIAGWPKKNSSEP